MPAVSRPTEPVSRASTPILAASDDSLLTDVIGERRGGAEKGACRIARRIEESLIVSGWPYGAVCGSEQALAERFGAGRAVIREAVRILAVRGTARMVRGPRGGLQVLALDSRHTAAFLVGFGLFFGVTPVQLDETEAALDRVRLDLDALHLPGPEGTSRFAAVFAFFEDVVRAVRQAVSDGGSVRSSVLLTPEHLRHSRAGQIAERMLLECTAEEWARGRRLGSEEDLCFRYGADRDAFRQAVRILESAGAAETFCGRGHGLVSQAPREGTLARLVSCFFASGGVQAHIVMQVFERLSVGVIAMAASRASAEDCERVSQTLAKLEDSLERQDAVASLPHVFDAEEAIASVIANPLLQLFTKSLRGYPSARIPRDPALLDVMNRRFLTLSRPLLEALRNNNAQDAARAQKARVQGLARLSAVMPALASG
ncbi:FCD domain-containing protein [Caulobacter segnis]|uniref:Transcriptional regulators-like protein n=2 Tax=Caulobacter segnis TaxID=88688 RepID=D5VG97_CAUST|nr:FCD domain-containing protein [Caulobacter segnis]ADG10216.1 Transcriptional regulators-like protein [Caulobacter segnis ATCC 21756]AVQ01959.1 FCD domain-containing protein [Caulobacter segnis]